MKYQSFIGLEVHIHLLTKSKAFCSCRAAFGDEPNSNVCPVCMGYPGVLPALNGEAMRMGAVVARALNCTLSPKTWFERKQYFYPDMPKNYQISQFASPLGVDGWVDIPAGGGGPASSAAGTATKRIRIKECHLEEDAGKMIHAGNVSLVDYNRAGTSLLEIVTEPDFETGAEAECYVQQLRRTVRYLGVCDGNMEEGSLRCDANVSVNLRGQGLGSKVEIKNLNSSRFVRLGLDYEIERQVALVEKGGMVRQETRLWNENRDQTETMRVKESSNDYRFFPEPDLPPFSADAGFISSVEAGLVELPFDRERRVGSEFGLSREQVTIVCEERAFADYFEAAVAEAERLGMDKKVAAERVAIWMTGELKRVMNRDGLGAADVGALKVTGARLAAIVALVASGRISGKIARQLFDAALVEEAEPADIVAARGWELVVDPARIAAAVEEAIAAEPSAFSGAAAATAGGDVGKARTLSAFLVGKAIGASGGKAEPGLVKAAVEARVTAAATAL
ncbi:MAG: Asp-tRNA(Asn)/Glu-tRNA(Gln) amidotransferase GatCAB subunit B [Spirochaetae bacterium HGW-Spirochaetae-3]|nr:MAG: Asp-tRNA(Asn)/Glu-tRNA(Gln) amidotransferase GatCAB subunit B [Spirochaetae bacterium HGW-Spirochaetae-3]